MRPTLIFSLAGFVLLSGCGGGGGSTSDSLPGGNVIAAGSLRAQGFENAKPLSGVNSGVTTYAVTGNFSSASWADQTPTLAETEFLFSSQDPTGSSINAVQPDGSGRRTIISGLLQPATNLVCDPAGRFVFYIRNRNLQRTDIRTGASNTLVANVASLALDSTGSKVFYRKLNTSEIWSASFNGANQQLLFTTTSAEDVVGCHDDTHLITRDVATGKSITLRDLAGSFRAAAALGNVVVHWAAFNPVNHIVYFGVNDSSVNAPNYFIRFVEFSLDQNTAGSLISFGPGADLPVGQAAGGPDQETLVCESFDKIGTVTIDGIFHSTVTPAERNVFSVAWTPFRTNLPLVGTGTPFAGAAALLASELGTKTPSIVVADCVTRSTMSVKSLNETGVGNPLYELDCDNLSRLSVANGNGYVFGDIVSSASGLKGAILSFDAGTGKVANVLTFTKKPLVTKSPSGFRIEGDLGEQIDAGTGKRQPATSGLVIR